MAGYVRPEREVSPLGGERVRGGAHDAHVEEEEVDLCLSSCSRKHTGGYAFFALF